jgi:hypothetical protein
MDAEPRGLHTMGNRHLQQPPPSHAPKSSTSPLELRPQPWARCRRCPRAHHYSLELRRWASSTTEPTTMAPPLPNLCSPEEEATPLVSVGARAMSPATSHTASLPIPLPLQHLPAPWARTLPRAAGRPPPSAKKRRRASWCVTRAEASRHGSSAASGGHASDGAGHSENRRRREES